MTDLRQALKQGCVFTIYTKADDTPVIVVKRDGDQVFVQTGTKELDIFEQLEVAAQAANRLIAEGEAFARYLKAS